MDAGFEIVPTEEQHERPPSSTHSSVLQQPNELHCHFLPPSYYINQQRRPNTTAGISPQRKKPRGILKNKNRHVDNNNNTNDNNGEGGNNDNNNQKENNNNNNNIAMDHDDNNNNDDDEEVGRKAMAKIKKRPATHDGSSPSKQSQFRFNVKPPTPTGKKKYKRELSAHTKKLFQKFEEERKRYIDKVRMTYSITPLDPDAYEEKRREKERHREKTQWNTRYRPHDIMIEKKKEDEQYRAWTASSAGANVEETEKNRIASLSETQKQLASFFNVENHDKYINRIPPLMMNKRNKKPNPYLNLPPTAPAPKIPRRPHKLSPRRLRPNLNPYSEKQILWPKDKEFDLTQYKLMYAASKKVIREEASCWHAFWANNEKNKPVRHRMEGNPFSYSNMQNSKDWPPKMKTTNTHHQRSSNIQNNAKNKRGGIRNKRQVLSRRRRRRRRSTDKENVIQDAEPTYVEVKPISVAPSIIKEEMEPEDLAEQLFYGKKMYIKAIRPSTTATSSRRPRFMLNNDNRNGMDIRGKKNVRWTRERLNDGGMME